MNIIQTTLPGVLLIEPKVFGDERGFFFESFNALAFAQATGVTTPFVQDNHSHSGRGVLRGLHYQIEQAQGKLVRAVTGEVYDAVVDLRRSSPTFGRCEGFVLSAQNKRMLWVPPGFGHGYYVLSESTDFLYKTTDYYAPQHERCVLWNDPAVGVPWPLSGGEPILSGKDKLGLRLADAPVYP
ncbi:MAG TPA: dTDP-4-dehydrorhamnose 3,5-epimerase [Burkholderiaceae bacterium]|nr:dTDP-4-dehydrorhamnose 3,5-epimerase [Burkholderiaceae bacterium]